MEQFDRIIKQLGIEKFSVLNKKHIILFGLGGVGGSIAETLVRSGLGEITLVDGDIVDITNLNRQIIALHSNVGQNKVDVCEQRLKDINPKVVIHKYNVRYPSAELKLDFSSYDYVVDAIDDVKAKVEIIKNAKLCNKPVISAMGAGNKFNPLALKVADIENTNTCPLAKIVRNQLKDLGIKNVKCVFSTEKSILTEENIITSNAFVPNVMGIIMAKEVIFDLIQINEC